MRAILLPIFALALAGASVGRAAPAPLRLTCAEYEDRVHAVWAAQIVAVILDWPFEHQVASTVWVDQFPRKYTVAPVDDDWYYEMCAVRGFEKHGPSMTVEQLDDRIKGDKMGGVELTPPVDETISDLARRTAAVGEKILAANGAKISSHTIDIPPQEPVTQPAELFKLADLMQYWNPDWTLERAGFGGAGGGMGGIRGITYLDGDLLATYPRDEVRSCVLRRTLKLSATPTLRFQAGCDAGRTWELIVYVNNKMMVKRAISGKAGSERTWEEVAVDLAEYAGQTVHLRLYQRVLGFPTSAPREAGNAYWKALVVK